MKKNLGKDLVSSAMTWSPNNAIEKKLLILLNHDSNSSFIGQMWLKYFSQAITVQPLLTLTTSIKGAK
jgi:hypothetical protein